MLLIIFGTFFIIIFGLGLGLGLEVLASFNITAAKRMHYILL